MPPEVITVTLHAPTVPEGTIAVIDVEELMITEGEGVVPKFTVAPAAKLLPTIVKLIPPLLGPTMGLIELSVGTPK